MHYTDENGTLQQSVLALQKVEGQYTGKNLASIMLSVAEEYQIQLKLGFFIGNNAGNNDTIIRTISSSLVKDDISYDPKIHCLRCNDHIINLSVHAFLFETHPNAINNSDGSYELDSGPTKEELDRWKSFELLGKAHNLVLYIL